MSDLISRSALLKKVLVPPCDVVSVDDIKKAPAVDAVEVVYCRECKHWKHFDHLGCTDFVKVCWLANYMIGATGYCLYAERRADDGK